MGGRALSATQYVAALDSAVRRSVLRRFTPRARGLILAGAVRLDLPAKSYLRRPGEQDRLGLVVRGLARLVYVTPEGRDLTVTWAHKGDWLGTFGIFGAESGLFLQAVTAVVWCDLNTKQFRSLIDADIDVASLGSAVLEELVRRAIKEEALFAYGDLRTRVQRRLLEIACRGSDADLVAQVTQEELASSAGAARQSVARVLGDLRRRGVVRQRREGIVILRPDALLDHPRRTRAA